MQIQKRLPDVVKTVGEGRGYQVVGRLTRHLGDLLEVGAERDALAVRLGKPEVMLRVGRQGCLEGSKKSATFPMAALI